jgi:cysteine synthase B
LYYPEHSGKIPRLSSSGLEISVGNKDSSMKIINEKLSLWGAIGNTPLVEISQLHDNPKVRILAKLEGNNPGGSVKDRPALFMLQKAEESGALRPGKTILEPTSGNTGIALAMIGASKGYRVKLVMPGCVSLERRAVLEAYGAEVVLSPAEEATDGAIRMAHRILEESPAQFFMPNQYANENNPLSHYYTTGPEIMAQTGGKIDVFVAGMGTSGTLMGMALFLKEQNPAIRVVGVEPVLGHKVQGLKNMQEAIVPAIYNPARLDEKLVVDDETAFETTRQLAIREGVFAGMSSGAAVAGAIRIARSMESGTIVTLLPDRGDRYLSTTLFRSTCAACPP